MRNKKLQLENPKRGDHFEDLCVDGRIILKGTLKKWGVGMWTGFFRGSAEGPVLGSCEHGNEYSRSIN
jgi:hypothetical protein